MTNDHNKLHLLATGVLIVAAACAHHAARANDTAFDDLLPLQRLERLFWDCDALSTRVALTAGDGALCAQATDALKRRRFGGDFERLLAWWRANKAAEHAARESTELDAMAAP